MPQKQDRAYKLSRMCARALSFMGWFMACLLTLSSFLSAWLMPFSITASPAHMIGCALASLVMAARLEFHDDKDDR